MPKNHKDGRGWTDAKAAATFPIGILPVVADAGEAPDVSAPRPALSALKPEWVAYAETIGVDTSGSKRDIIARVGS